MTRGHRRNVHLGSESGQAMVEFALILPALLAIVFGIIQFGTAFNYWNDLNQMAADGARFAAVNKVPGQAGGSLTAFITSQGDSGELSNGTTVSYCWIPDPSAPAHFTAAAGDAIRVTTSYPIKIDYFGWQYTLRGKATMRLEATPTAFNPGSQCA
jgi:Flp pilus assembly protein TadG